MERPIAIDGTIVTAKAWQLNEQEQRFDYSYEVKAVAEFLHQQEQEAAPRLIIIAAPAGYGKTMLAKALEANLESGQYVSCLHSDGTPGALTDSDSVYFLDAASWLDAGGWEQVQQYAEEGVGLVLFVQTLREIQLTCEHITYELPRR